MFKKGDYIVTLKVTEQYYNCARNNFCFKIRETKNCIYPEVDMEGNTDNGHVIMSFDKRSSLKDWRYATTQEIAEYDRIGKPYDVTTITIKTLNKDTVKVGQKVRVIDEDARELGFESIGNNDDFKKGDVGIITNINGGGYSYDNNHLWVYIDDNIGGIITGLLELVEGPKSETKEPEVLVFGKFKIGSIVVSLEEYGKRKEGDIIKVIEQSDAGDISSEIIMAYSNSKINSSCGEPSQSNLRLASDEEIKAFESGITNIKDMKKEEEDLVGRYIKALKDSPQNTGIKKDNFAKITYANSYNYQIDNGCGVSKVNLPTDWELMPIGFNPSEVKEEHSFYVKYEPDFTEDIFNKLKEWCNPRMPKGKKWYTFTTNQYNDFKYNKWFWVDSKTKTDNFCGVDNNYQSARNQLSLSELCTLIGYKPEVDKHFKDYSFKGKWIQAAHWGSTSFAKCDYFTEGVVYFTECIRNGVYTEVSTWWGNSQTPNRLKEVSLSEIQKYLPEGHVDKIPNTSEEFKVGDWVTLIRNSAMSCNSVGDTGKVTEVYLGDDICRVKVLNKPEKDNNSYFKDIRKATPEEIGRAKAQGYKAVIVGGTCTVPLPDEHLKYSRIRHTFDSSNKYLNFFDPAYSEEYPIFAEPKKQKYKFSETEYLAKPINQQLDLPIIKKYKKKSIINL
jgi:hypothetical protein